MSGVLAGIVGMLRSLGSGVVTSNIRQQTLAAQTEAGTGPYAYTSTGDGGACNSTGSIPLASDGRFEITATTISGTDFFLLSPTNGTQQDLGGTGVYGFGPGAPGDGFTIYDGASAVSANVDGSVTSANGQKWAFGMYGKVVTIEIFTGGVWKIIHIFATARVGTLYPQVRTFSSGNVNSAWTQVLGQSQAHCVDQSVNLVADGNSLMFRDAGAGTMLDHCKRKAPLLGSRTPLVNVSVDGQTTEDMTSSASDVDAAWVSGKINVLLIWEGTNSIANVPDTYLQAATALQSYITARQAVHTWNYVVVMLTIPRHASIPDGATLTNLNQALLDYNNYLIANRVSLGISAIVDLRPSGGPFNFTTWTTAGFSASGAGVGGLYYDVSPNELHLSDAGNEYVANLVVATLATLGIA